MSSWFNPKTEERTSPIQGRGLVARDAIAAGEVNPGSRWGVASLLGQNFTLTPTLSIRPRMMLVAR